MAVAQTTPAVLKTLVAIANRQNTQLETLRAEIQDMRGQMVTNHQQLQKQIAQVTADVQQIHAKLPAEQHKSPSARSSSPQPSGTTLSFDGTPVIALDNTMKSRSLQRQFDQAKGEADLVHADAGLFGGRSAIIMMLHPVLCFVFVFEIIKI